ncbi:MAG: hypothetical protein MUE84_05490 [Hyphomonas sp.]|jgi:hypothetical protein|nr:hypothetical protein [Hyphomonas sp.]
MNLADYAIRLFQRTPSAVPAPLAPGAIGEWRALEHQCHANAAHWCIQHPDYRHVPGWLYFSFEGLLPNVRFTAHSVVQTPSGGLVDITPTRASRPYPFIPAEESLDEYVSYIERQRIIHLDLYVEENRVEVHRLEAPGNSVV